MFLVISTLVQVWQSHRELLGGQSSDNVSPSTSVRRLPNSLKPSQTVLGHFSVYDSIFRINARESLGSNSDFPPFY